MSMDSHEAISGWFDFYFTIGTSKLEYATKGVYVFKCMPRTFGTLVALRCVNENIRLPLTGRHEEPTVKDSQDRESSYLIKGGRKVVTVPIEEAWNVFTKAIYDEHVPMCVSSMDNKTTK